MSGGESGYCSGPDDDPMAPPKEPCECYCLHCGRVFMSDQMWFQKVINASDGFDGFWMCPTPNCDGAGFCFDIFPTDPNHPANEGWVWDDDEDEANDPDADWDETESKYQEMEKESGDEDPDLEGEEWKEGLKPGEERPETDEMRQAREAWEAQQKRYDEPDERPRVLDWKDERRPEAGQWGDEDIPF